MQDYLAATEFIDWQHPAVRAYTHDATRNAATRKEKAIHLFYAVRDDIRYDPYSFKIERRCQKASYTLAAKSAYCIPKAILLAACYRAVGIPSRLGFADVKNHITTPKMRRMLEDVEVLIYHGYTALYLDNRWIKVTPAFNLSLCRKFGIRPLEFDGEHDSLFHEYDIQGNKHMEYVRDRGQYADLPFEQIMDAFKRYYPRLIDADLQGDFYAEAEPHEI